MVFISGLGQVDFPFGWGEFGHGGSFGRVWKEEPGLEPGSAILVIKEASKEEANQKTNHHKEDNDRGRNIAHDRLHQQIGREVRFLTKVCGEMPVFFLHILTGNQIPSKRSVCIYL